MTVLSLSIAFTPTVPSSKRVKIDGGILWAFNSDPAIIILVVIPLLNDKSALSASIVISKVLVLVSAEGEIKEILPVFFTPLVFSIIALVPTFTLLTSNSDR